MNKISFVTIIFISIVFVGGIFVFRATFNEAKRKSQIEKEIDELKQEAEKIKKENSSLSENITYFQTEDFQEKEAKQKLNLQKQGENVVIIKPSPFQEEIRKEEKTDKENKIEVPNYKKWWDYFFK